MNLQNIRGMGSVEYAAVQAYGARLSMKPEKNRDLSQVQEDDLSSEHMNS